MPVPRQFCKSFCGTAPVVNKEQSVYWTVGTKPRVGAVLAWYSPSPETKLWQTTDFWVMPVLNQYRFQCWHGTGVQHRASTDGQLSAMLPLRAVPVVGRAYASTMALPRQYYKSFCGTDTVLARYWRSTGAVLAQYWRGTGTVSSRL